MKHVKHTLALLLSLLLIFQIAGPALPGLDLTASAAGMKWLDGTGLNAAATLKKLGDIKDRTPFNKIKWTEIGEAGDPDKFADIDDPLADEDEED